MDQQGNHNRKQSILKSMMVKIKQIKTEGSTLMGSRTQESKPVVTFGGKPERIKVFALLIALLQHLSFKHLALPFILPFLIKRMERNHLSNFNQET